MKPRTPTFIMAVILIAPLTIPVPLAARDQEGQKKKQDVRYILTDLGPYHSPSLRAARN